MHTADYCPMNIMPVTGTNSRNGIFEFNCANDTLSSDIAVEYYGAGSRCIETNQARPYCLRMVCDSTYKKVVVYVNNAQIICQNDGDFMDIPSAGTQGLPSNAQIQCPILNIVCPE